MILGSIPTKTPTVWGKNAASGYIRAVPNASQKNLTIGAASYADGFVPANFTPVAAGGVPPFGQDMNGVLQQITQWQQWYQAGGTIIFDPTFQSVQGISGYPIRARVESAVTPYLIWQSTMDNNSNNPDDPVVAKRIGWQQPVFPDPTYLGIPSFIGALKIDGSANTAYGANIAFYGNAKLSDGVTNTTAPNKYLRALNGSFRIDNNAYSAPIFALTDGGAMTVPGAINGASLSVTGNISGDTLTIPKNANGAANSGNASVGGDFFVGNAGWTFHNDSTSVPIDVGHPDGLAHHKYNQYNGGNSSTNYGYWFDKWNGATGSREWHGPVWNAATVATDDFTAMELHIGHPPSVALDEIYLQLMGDFRMGMAPSESPQWRFQQRVNPTELPGPGFNSHSVHDKYTFYEAAETAGYWYEKWDGNTGDREWHGPLFTLAPPANPTGDFIAMKLHIGDQPNVVLHDIWLQVFGQIRTDTLNVTGASSQSGTFPNPATTSTNTNGIGDSFGIATTGYLHAGNNFSPNSYNNGEWELSVDANGSKYQIYSNTGSGTGPGVSDAYDVWVKTNYSRNWIGALGGPGGAVTVLMLLDNLGNLTTTGTVSARNVTAMEQAIERITTRLNALDGGSDEAEGDDEHAPA